MRLVILDTNVLVSGMFAHLQNGNPARLIRMFIEGDFTLIYSHEIFEEYEEVLRRPKFHFLPEDIAFILNAVKDLGFCEHILPGLTGHPRCPHPDDQKFYDLALSTDSLLITGNIKHYPSEIRVLSPTDYLHDRIASK